MRRRRAAALVVVILSLAACSGGASGDASDPTPSSPTTSTTTTSSTTPTTSTSTTSTTDSAGTDIAVVTSALQQLVDSYDDVVQAILADPRVAADRNHQLVADYLALFPEGSAFASGTLDFWASQGAAGRFYRAGPRGEMYQSTVQSVDLRSDREAVARVCTETSVLVVDAAGSPIESQGGVNGGEIVAVRDGDRWLLRDLTEASPDGCPGIS